MPSTSKKQHNLMAAVAHNPAFAKKAGIPQSVGKHFSDADKGKKFKEGGDMKHPETKEIAQKEMKALKRGHAPKDVMEHEREEHKSMGYKEGGKVHLAKSPKEEVKRKGFPMAETKGGRKTPHGKHDAESDTKLKGFGMGKGTGKGRTVTKAEKPKDEEPRKSFAMKKGGHVKHEGKKHMARGGMSARPMGRPTPKAAMPGLPAGLGAALAGAGGGMGGGLPPGGGMGGASPMPQPGMKKGGHVIQHHHHYASGGDVRHGIDEKAERGHTKGKQVKMAEGGHVGSHPSRRGDGAAAKGHTRCKIV